MEPFTIITGCVALTGTAVTLSTTISTFVRDVRSARSDLHAVSRELGSLQLILKTLQDDFEQQPANFPETLRDQVIDITSNCDSVLKEIDVVLKVQKSSRLGEAAKWTLRGKEDVKKLRLSLEAHRSALEIALDFVNLNISREIKTDTTEIRAENLAIKTDTEHILAEINRLRGQLPKDTSNNFLLDRYLDNLTIYAESVVDDIVMDQEIAGSSRTSEQHQRKNSSDEAVDSLVDSTNTELSTNEASIRGNEDQSSNAILKRSQMATGLLGMARKVTGVKSRQLRWAPVQRTEDPKVEQVDTSVEETNGLNEEQVDTSRLINKHSGYLPAPLIHETRSRKRTGQIPRKPANSFKTFFATDTPKEFEILSKGLFKSEFCDAFGLAKPADDPLREQVHHTIVRSYGSLTKAFEAGWQPLQRTYDQPGYLFAPSGIDPDSDFMELLRSFEQNLRATICKDLNDEEEFSGDIRTHFLFLQISRQRESVWLQSCRSGPNSHIRPTCFYEFDGRIALIWLSTPCARIRPLIYVKNDDHREGNPVDVAIANALGVQGIVRLAALDTAFNSLDMDANTPPLGLIRPIHKYGKGAASDGD